MSTAAVQAERNSALEILGAVAPIAISLGGAAVFLAMTGGIENLAHFLMESGFIAYPVIIFAIIGSIVLAALGYFIVRGVSVPVFIGVGVAAFPWVLGLLGTMTGMAKVWSAISVADASEKTALLAVGAAEAFSTRMLGSWCAGVLLAGFVLPLAFAALVQRSKSAALWAATALVAATSYLAMTTSLATRSLQAGLKACGFADPSTKAAILSKAISESLVLEQVMMWGMIFIVAASMALAVWAVTKKPTVGQWLGGVALAAVVGVTYGIDYGATQSAQEPVLEGVKPFWKQSDSFVPVVAPGGRTGQFDALVLPGKLVPFGAPPVALTDSAALVAALRKRADAPREKGFWEEPQADDTIKTAEIVPDPKLSIAFDEKVSAQDLLRILRGARVADVHSLELLGTNVSPEARAEIARVERAAPILAALAGSQSTKVDVLLEASLPEDHAAFDPDLHHGRITTAATLKISTRVGSGSSGLTIDVAESLSRDLEEAADPALDQKVVYLAVGDDVTAEVVHLACAALGARGFRPLLVTGAIPGSPESSVQDTLGKLDGPRDDDGRIIIGTLDKEIIRRVIKRSIPRVRYCYEKELIRTPGIAGKVKTEFTISPKGSVAKASVTESTLGHKAVEECILRSIRKMKFPKPKGGGIVIVKYPFIFKTSD